MNIETIIEFITQLTELADPQAAWNFLKKFIVLPPFVTVIIEWALDHQDCLAELFDALRGKLMAVDSDTNKVLTSTGAELPMQQIREMIEVYGS